MTIDLTTGLAILVPTLGLFLLLVKMLRDNDLKRVVALETQLREAERKIDKISDTASDIKASVAGLTGRITHGEK